MNKLFCRRVKIVTRAPAFYFRKLRRRIFGIDDAWLRKTRDDYPLGSWQWLALTEKLYGGFKVGTATGRDRGGDRMSPFYHGYGESYQEFLKPFLARREERLTLVEVGILNGSGLAIWCDLFPNARIIGLDINLTNFHSNLPTLKAAGAFSRNKPEVHEFNQLDSHIAQSVLKNVLHESKVNIVIDDGCHSMESIQITLTAMLPYLSQNGVYFIEDNFDTYESLAKMHRNFHWFQRGEIVVFTNKI